MEQFAESFERIIPKLSVVTLAKEDSVGLSKTIESLNQQDFHGWEQIIVVAESKDQTEEVATAAARDPRRFVILQKDTGIYQAMNTALNAVKGDFVWFMNSGDVFESTNTAKTALDIISSSNSEVLIGGYSFFLEGKNYSIAKRTKNLSAIEISLNRRGLCHQSIIYRTQSLRKINGYDVRYKLAADFKSVLDASKLGNVLRIPDILSVINLGGVSQTQIESVLREKQQIRQEIFGKLSLNFFFGYLWTIAVKAKIIARENRKFLNIK